MQDIRNAAINTLPSEEKVRTAVRFYNAVASAYKAKFRKAGVKKLKLYNKALSQIEDQDHKVDVMEFYVAAMLEELGGDKSLIKKLDDEDDKQESYSTLNLSQRRGLFLARYMERNPQIKSLTTHEAKIILSTVESGLKNMQVIRALKMAAKLIHHKVRLDHIGPWMENRLKILDFNTKKEFFVTQRDNRVLWSGGT